MSLLDHLRHALWWLPFGRVAEISPGELSDRLCGADPPQVLDVRTTLEWRRSRIEEAANVPIQELRKSLDRLSLDKHRPVVAICLSAHRSIPAVRLLQARGFEQAMQLRGGMLAWWKQQLPTVSDEA